MKKVISVLLAFLLTGALILFCVSFLVRQEIIPAMDVNGAKPADTVVRGEHQLIRERVVELSELYDFNAEPVNEWITEDMVRDLSGQALRWWGGILRDGKTGPDLEWDSEDLQEIVSSNQTVATDEDRERAEYLWNAGIEDINRNVTRIVLPLRQQIVRLGVQKGGKMVDIPNVTEFLIGVPWAALALCALLAGLIALTESRDLRRSLRYIGAALGAAVLVMVAVTLLFLCAGIYPVVEEVSRSLAIMYQDAVIHTLIRSGILMLVMIIGCALCLATCRERKTA